MGHDLQVYLNWDLYPIITIFLLGILIAFLPMIYDGIRKYCKSCCPCLRKRKRLFEGLMFQVSKVVLLKEFKQKVEDGKKVYYMRDQYIPTILMRFILYFSFQAAVITVTLAVTTGWVTFLIEETFACDPGLDCFPFTEDGDSIQGYPIVNCTDFLSADNITITCYRFALQYAQGLSAAGGVFVFSAFVITAYTFTMFVAARLIWPKNEGSDDDDDSVDSEELVMDEAGSSLCKCCDCDCTSVRIRLGRILFGLIALSPSVLALLILNFVLSVDFFNKTVLKTSSTTIQFVAYYISLQYVGFFAVGALTILVVYIARSEHLKTHDRQAIPSTRPANESTSTSRDNTPLLRNNSNLTTQYNT